MKINKEYLDQTNQEGEGGEEGGGKGGKGGKSGEVHFRYQDPTAVPQRDDLLPFDEVKRLLIVEQELHKASVDKQKNTRKDRQALKAGRANTATFNYRTGVRSGNSGRSPYKKHWVSNKAQFSGIDRNVTAVPTDNTNEANEANRNKLAARLELRNANRHVHTPTFNPKPRPY